MNAPLLPEIFSRRDSSPQADLLPAAEDVLRYVWESKFGSILIEVREGRVFVNKQAVELSEQPAVVAAAYPTTGRSNA